MILAWSNCRVFDRACAVFEQFIHCLFFTSDRCRRCCNDSQLISPVASDSSRSFSQLELVIQSRVSFHCILFTLNCFFFSGSFFTNKSDFGVDCRRQFPPTSTVSFFFSLTDHLVMLWVNIFTHCFTCLISFPLPFSSSFTHAIFLNLKMSEKEPVLLIAIGSGVPQHLRLVELQRSSFAGLDKRFV